MRFLFFSFFCSFCAVWFGLFFGIGHSASPSQEIDAAKAGGQIDTPPVYTISATSLYDAGFQHGKLAASRIAGWLESEEVRQAIDFTRGAGHKAFEKLKKANAEAFPELAEEVRGIADGAGLDVDSIWVSNLLQEVEQLKSPRSEDGEHCSDFASMHTPLNTDGFGHAHNEDWSPEAGKFYYYLKYTALAGANFSSCAGFSYAGMVIGFAPTWNSHGIYMDMNTLVPPKNSWTGLGCGFVARQAVCGPSGEHGLDAIVQDLGMRFLSSGTSVNLMDLRARRQINVEKFADKQSVLEITSNYSHFNLFKHEDMKHFDNNPNPSSLHRQTRADMLPAPQSIEDLKALLSDTGDAKWPIFRTSTVASFVLDGSGKLDVWCCGNAPATTKPFYSWNLHHFFDEQKLKDTPLFIQRSRFVVADCYQLLMHYFLCTSPLVYFRWQQSVFSPLPMRICLSHA